MSKSEHDLVSDAPVAELMEFRLDEALLAYASGDRSEYVVRLKQMNDNGFGCTSRHGDLLPEKDWRLT